MPTHELRDLQRIIAGGGSAMAIDEALCALSAYDNPGIVGPVLSLLNDDGDQDGMWSILHMAESFDDRDYVAGLLAALPALLQGCPEWASILLIRVLNSESCNAEMARQLGGASALEKIAAITICDGLVQDDAGFAATAALVIAAARV